MGSAGCRQGHGARWFVQSLLALFGGACVGVVAANAQDATWVGNGTATGSWNTNANWNPNPPGQPSGIATFNVSPTTTVTFSASSAIDTILFNSPASAYSFN